MTVFVSQALPKSPKSQDFNFCLFAFRATNLPPRPPHCLPPPPPPVPPPPPLHPVRVACWPVWEAARSVDSRSWTSTTPPGMINMPRSIDSSSIALPFYSSYSTSSIGGISMCGGCSLLTRMMMKVPFKCLLRSKIFEWSEN